MSAGSVRPARSRLEVAALRACVACFGLFCANVLLRRATRALEWDATWLLDRVPEFLLLFASAVLFAVACLAAERRDQACSGRGSAPVESLPEEPRSG